MSLPEYFRLPDGFESGDVGRDIHRQEPGPASYGTWKVPSRDLTPESLRGSRGNRDLTLGIALGAPVSTGGVPPI